MFSEQLSLARFLVLHATWKVPTFSSSSSRFHDHVMQISYADKLPLCLRPEALLVFHFFRLIAVWQSRAADAALDTEGGRTYHCILICFENPHFLMLGLEPITTAWVLRTFKKVYYFAAIDSEDSIHYLEFDKCLLDLEKEMLVSWLVFIVTLRSFRESGRSLI